MAWVHPLLWRSMPEEWLNTGLCSTQLVQVIGLYLPNQSASKKHNQEEKSPQTFAHLMNFSEYVSAMFYNHQSEVYMI